MDIESLALTAGADNAAAGAAIVDKSRNQVRGAQRAARLVFRAFLQTNVGLSCRGPRGRNARRPAERILTELTRVQLREERAQDSDTVTTEV